MPNWCSTTYKCVGSPKEVRALGTIIKRNARRKNPRVKNGFGTLWLGCIIDELGYDWKKYQCRGEIIDYDMNSDATMLTIYQDTAWCEQEGFRQAIEEKFPSIKVYYQEEEPGCEVFNTNSFEYFPDRYFLDSDDEQEYFETIEDAAKYVSDIVGYKVDPSSQTIEDALDKYEEEHDTWFSFHEFQLIEEKGGVANED